LTVIQKDILDKMSESFFSPFFFKIKNLFHLNLNEINLNEIKEEFIFSPSISFSLKSNFYIDSLD